ncbi:MAG: chitobiase/beta-hexosaminidase C-terminal domain-containing protein, partial [Terracidiphilus sp.]
MAGNLESTARWECPILGNTPGGRSDASGWIDSSGNFWIFGGQGYDAKGSFGLLNDLWEFIPATNRWTWMGGSSTLIVMDTQNDYGRPGVYGALGVFGPGNIPGGRRDASVSTDRNGNFWLFGGMGYSAIGCTAYCNDLWQFSPASNQWAWMSGSGAGSEPGTYGTLGTPAVGNVPGSRTEAVTWIDSDGSLWLFGGDVLNSWFDDSTINDLWKFNSSTAEWAWMGGASTLNCQGNVANCGVWGIYGNLGKPSATNIPGSRSYASNWTDGGGNLWLFGGEGHDANNVYGYLNDLWEYEAIAPISAAATPAFSVSAGTYPTNQSITISDTTAGATIYYTTNGTTPTTSSTVYSGPIVVSSTETIEAIATASGFSTSAVASATYTIPQNFTLSLNPTSITVQAGQSGTSAITVQDEGGFNGNVSFACSGLPAGATCNFSLLTVPTPAGVSYTTLTVSTSSTTTALDHRGQPLIPAAVLAVAFCCFGLRRRRRIQTLLLLAVSVAGLGVLSGCGGAGSGGGGSGGGSQPVTSTITVTAMSGSLQQSTPFT